MTTNPKYEARIAALELQLASLIECNCLACRDARARRAQLQRLEQHRAILAMPRREQATAIAALNDYALSQMLAELVGADVVALAVASDEATRQRIRGAMPQALDDLVELELIEIPRHVRVTVASDRKPFHSCRTVQITADEAQRLTDEDLAHLIEGTDSRDRIYYYGLYCDPTTAPVYTCSQWATLRAIDHMLAKYEDDGVITATPMTAAENRSYVAACWSRIPKWQRPTYPAKADPVP